MRNVTVITLAVNLWLAGRCPPILAEFVASAPLTPLLKPDNGIRPIAVGLIWRHFGFQGCHESIEMYIADTHISLLVGAARDRYWRFEEVSKDHILRDSGICGMDDDYVSALSCLRDTIPSFDFSGFTNKDTAPSKAQQTLTNVLFSEMFKDMEVHFDMNMRQKAVFECLRAPHA
ncbi:hypothetical protein Tco_0090434 [Tanacetum coccineum]